MRNHVKEFSKLLKKVSFPSSFQIERKTNSRVNNEDYSQEQLKAFANGVLF